MKKLQENIKSLYAQKPIRLGLYILGTLFVLSATFQLGLFVGYHKASFARDWGDHYERNFGMRRPESIRGMMGNTLPGAYGASGKVLSVTLPTFVVEDINGTEKTIHISDTTLIRLAMQNASSSAITVDNIVIVLGEPNDAGQIEAKLIRVMPAGFTTGTSTRGMMYGSTTPSGRGWMMFRR